METKHCTETPEYQEGVKANENGKPRTVRPENWQTLAGTLYDLLGGYLTNAEISEFRIGRPNAAAISRAVRGCRRCIHTTYNGQQRAACKALVQTLVNYGLVQRADVSDLLPEA